jgi:BolA family transcriptional regulator, general stress-responsive regulator
MSVADTIRAKLEAGLAPIRLEIADESHRHLGHAAARPEGETHFRVAVVSAAFAGKSRVERQRIVYRLLAVEMGNPIHALQLTTLAPEEVGTTL